jgi:hypothetical protein
VQDTLHYEKKVGLIKRGELVPLPIIYYSPETSLALGGMVINLFRVNERDSISPLSNIRVVLGYTLRNQLIANLEHTLFLKHDRLRISGNLTYAGFPDFFYGIGNNTLLENEEVYSSKILNFTARIQRKIGPNLFIGFQYNLNHVIEVDPAVDGMLADRLIPGSAGGVNSSPGIMLLKDTRDNVYSAFSGHYLEISSRHARQAFGSAFNYDLLELDFRKFFNLDKMGVLAFQTKFNFSSGDIPFHRLAQLGGPEIMRGHYKGRFRDNNLWALQGEYRFKLVGRLGMVAFAGVGDVFNQSDQLAFNNTKWAAGTGFRFDVKPKERIKIRLDFGFSSEEVGIYFNIAEAF